MVKQLLFIGINGKAIVIHNLWRSASSHNTYIREKNGKHDFPRETHDGILWALEQQQQHEELKMCCFFVSLMIMWKESSTYHTKHIYNYIRIYIIIHVNILWQVKTPDVVVHLEGKRSTAEWNGLMAIHGGSTVTSRFLRPFIVVGHKLVYGGYTIVVGLSLNNMLWKGRVPGLFLVVYPNIFKICGTIHLQNHVSLLALQLR